MCATQGLIFHVLLVHLVDFRYFVRVGLDANSLGHVRQISLLFILGLLHHERSRHYLLHIDPLVRVVLASLAFLLELG